MKIDYVDYPILSQIAIRNLKDYDKIFHTNDATLDKLMSHYVLCDEVINIARGSSRLINRAFGEISKNILYISNDEIKDIHQDIEGYGTLFNTDYGKLSEYVKANKPKPLLEHCAMMWRDASNNKNVVIWSVSEKEQVYIYVYGKFVILMGVCRNGKSQFYKTKDAKFRDITQSQLLDVIRANVILMSKKQEYIRQWSTPVKPNSTIRLAGQVLPIVNKTQLTIKIL